MDHINILKQVESYLLKAGLARTSTIEECLNAEKLARTFLLGRIEPGAYEPLSIRASDHFDFQVDGVVVDHELGTIGLLHLLDEDPTTPTTDVDRRIEEAGYLRHLLALASSGHSDGQPRALAYAVEIVFFATAAQHQLVGDALRECLCNTSLPHGFGVGIARIDAENWSGPESASMRRAFCWLLTATRRWFGEIEDHPPGIRTEWGGLELSAFRRHGVRRWRKQPKARLHLVQGANGTGKSSLAEAFEYAVTGHSTRLPTRPAKPDDDYYRPLIYQDGATSTTRRAEVRILAPKLAPPLPDETVVLKRSAPPQVASDSAPIAGLSGHALRLDQKLVDHLASETPERRAQIWLETYFADYDAELRVRQKTHQDLRAAIAGLAPGAVEPSSRVPTLQGKAAMIKQTKSPSLLAWFENLLDLDSLQSEASLLASLGLELPNMLQQSAPAELGKGGTQGTPERDVLLKRIATALAHDSQLLGRWHAHATADLDRLLERLMEDVARSERPAAATEHVDRHRLFQRWLHQVALSDILQKSQVIARIRENVPATPLAGDVDMEGVVSLLRDITPRQSAAKLADTLQQAQENRAALRMQLSSTVDEKKATPVAAASATVHSREHLGPLRTAIQQGFFAPTLRADDEPAITEILVGRQAPSKQLRFSGDRESLEALRGHVQARRRAIRLLSPVVFGVRPPASLDPTAAEQQAKALLDLCESFVAYSSLESSAADRFLDVLKQGSLAAAIDELVAVFTPARWAYHPLETQINVGPEQFEMQRSLAYQSHGGLDAALVLNTAELNTLALTLHLLCATRVANPFRVMFLDDPLQNMDELTVTTVARGLARFMRLAAQSERTRDWDVVLLLHGEENTERILREATAAHYRFPWLLPAGGNGVLADSAPAEEIPEQAGSTSITLMTLKGFLAESA